MSSGSQQANGWRLSAVLASAAAVLCALALAASVGSVAAAAQVGRITFELTAAVESIRIADELEIALLLHARTKEPSARETLERDIRAALEAARGHVTSGREAELLGETSRALSSYLDNASPVEPVIELTSRLADINVRQARATEARVQGWAQTASHVGLAAAVLFLAAGGAVVWWLHSRAFRPFLAVVDAVNAYSMGHRDRRAVPHGPSEVRELAEAFNGLADELARQSQQQATMLSGVAHDLRNPLSTLKIAAAVLTSADGSNARPAQMIKRQIDRLDRMVGDLLEVGRLGGGQLQLRVDEHDVRELVENVVSLTRATTSTHEIEVDMAREPVVTRCDALRLEQVFENLLGNALKYTTPGGKVWIQVAAQDGSCTVTFADEGVGISNEEQAAIFEPFRRARSASASNVPGLGLGLFMSRQLVEAHGGRIDVRSSPGAGSSFTIHLPRSNS